jgi:hypothetical protein
MAVIEQLRDLERQVVARLRELEPMVAEYRELEQVAQRLGIERRPAQQTRRSARTAPAAPKAGRGRTAARTARRRRNAAAPGSRQRDVLRLISEHPGITVPDLGRELSVDPTGLYQIVRRLENRGEIRKVGPRLEPVTAAAEPPAEPQPPVAA